MKQARTVRVVSYVDGAPKHEDRVVWVHVATASPMGYSLREAKLSGDLRKVSR
jgi:hypothetical protein